MSHKRKSPAPVGQPGSGIETRNHDSSRGRETKELRILPLLYAGKSLNRFEAIGHSDTCLNSTVSRLQGRGIEIARHPETVRTRRGYVAHVKRYGLLRTPENLKRARALLEKKGGAI